jgi:hypothetical protein
MVRLEIKTPVAAGEFRLQWKIEPPPGGLGPEAA